MLEEFFFFYYVFPKFLFFFPPIFPFFLVFKILKDEVCFSISNFFSNFSFFKIQEIIYVHTHVIFGA